MGLSSSKAIVCGLLAAGAAVFGVLQAWISTPFLSVSGTETSDGKWLLGLAIIALAVGLFGSGKRPTGFAWFILGAVGTVIVVTDLRDIEHVTEMSGMGPLLRPGMGLYLDLAALPFLAMSGLGVLFRRS